MLWLPPAVWCQGSQSTITGGSSCRNASMVRTIAWLVHSMRWVLITALGMPVEPEVNSSLPMVSGPTRAAAASRAPVGSLARSSAKGVAHRPAVGSSVTTSSVSGATAAAIAA
jgi:hypothetical protein